MHRGGRRGASATLDTEPVIEQESQFILRLPPEDAYKLHHLLDEPSDSQPRLSIDLDPSTRKATVKLDQKLLSGTLVDLPCIIESHKTFDKKNTYKLADISQMLICKPSSSEDPQTASAPDEKQFLFPHGLTPPLKNVRKRRFRKIRRKKQTDAPDEIERELKRLLRADLEAEDFRFEVIQKGSSLSAAPSSQLLKEDDLFGRVSSSEEEDDAMDAMDEAGSNAITSIIDEISAEHRASASASKIQEEVPEDPRIAQLQALEEQRLEVESALSRVQQQKRSQEYAIRGVDNPTLKQRMESDLEALTVEEMNLVTKMEEVQGAISELEMS